MVCTKNARSRQGKSDQFIILVKARHNYAGCLNFFNIEIGL